MSGTTLYLDWGGDFMLNQNGGLQMCVGWDYTRQFILRALLTNSQELLPNGIRTVPDYVFDPAYGIGLPAKVDGSYSQEYLTNLKQRITQACLSSADVNPASPPVVQYSQPDPFTLIVLVTVLLFSGAPGQIAFQVN